MYIREATVEDIHALHQVRISVTENRLSDPARVSHDDYKEFLAHKGKGWLCEVDDRVAGFAIVDLQEANIWALFVQPQFEHRGVGSALQRTMLDWYFAHTQRTLWLSTTANTRAEFFYRKWGWQEAGTIGDGEVKFEMSHANWSEQKERTRPN